MKPSERRALEAQRRAEEQEKRESAPAVEQRTEVERSKAASKGESFFARHSRLIAFIVTSFLIITVFSPFAIDAYLDARDKHTTVTDKKDITIEQVYFVADNYGDMTWESFNAFNYTDMSRDDGKYFTREYPIKDTGFVLTVGGKTLSGSPEYIYIKSYADAAYADLAKDNVKLFVNKYSKEE